MAYLFEPGKAGERNQRLALFGVSALALGGLVAWMAPSAVPHMPASPPSSYETTRSDPTPVNAWMRAADPADTQPTPVAPPAATMFAPARPAPYSTGDDRAF